MKKLLHLRFLSVIMLMLCGIGSGWAQSTLTITQSGLELDGTYRRNQEATIDGIKIGFSNLMKSNSSIQAQATEGELWNKEAIPGKITNIAINFETGMTARQSTIYYGTEAKCTTNGQTMSGSCSIDITGDYSFFYIKRGSNAAYWTSIVITYTPTLSSTVAIPTISPNGGTFTSAQTVTLSADEGTTIIYTTDGTTPSLENYTEDLALLYEEPFTISSSCTVKAIAVDEDYNESAVASAAFTIKKSIANTQETAYTVAQAKALIDNPDSNLEEEVYVKGKICKIDNYNSNYNSITYWISEDGTQTDMFEVYSGRGLNNTDFSSADDIELQAEVIIYGKIKKYNTTYEFDKENYLVSYKVKNVINLSFDPAEATYVMGRPFTAPTLVGAEGYEVVYFSGNNDVATVTDNGVVAAVAPGTTTIFAMIEETDDHFEATASYELTVTAVCEVTWSINGVTTTEEQLQGATISLPETPTAKGGKVFMGWSNSSSVNADGSDFTPLAADALVPSVNAVTYYAVFATESGSTPVNKTIYYEPFTGTAHNAGFGEDNVAATQDMFFDKTATVFSHYSNITAGSTTSYANNYDGNGMSDGIKIVKKDVNNTSVVMFEVTGIDIQNASNLSVSLYNRRTHTSAILKVQYKIDNGGYKTVGGEMQYNSTNDNWKFCDGLTIDGTGKQLSLKFTMSVGGTKNRTMLLDDIKVVGVINNASYSHYTTTIAEEQTLTVGTNGTSSFCSEYALDFTDVEDVKAYVATTVDGTTVRLSQVEGTVAANTGLLLVGEEGATADVPVVETGDVPATNLLKAAFNGSSIPCSDSEYTRYVFGTKNNVKGFYKLINNNMTSTGNFAYLEVPATQSSEAPARLSFIFDGEATGIDTVQSAEGRVQNGVYNLNGQKVSSDFRGIVIMNGKKVIK